MRVRICAEGEKDMGIFDMLSDHPEWTGMILIFFTLASDIVRYNKKMFYNNGQPNSASHYLNRKYHLDRMGKKVDIEWINKTLFLVNVAMLLISGAVILLVDLTIGVVVYLVLTMFAPVVAMRWIGERYTK